MENREIIKLILSKNYSNRAHISGKKFELKSFVEDLYQKNLVSYEEKEKVMSHMNEQLKTRHD